MVRQTYIYIYIYTFIHVYMNGRRMCLIAAGRAAAAEQSQSQPLIVRAELDSAEESLVLIKKTLCLIRISYQKHRKRLMCYKHLFSVN